MAMRDEDVQRLGEYVDEILPRRQPDISTQLLERMVRVEERIYHVEDRMLHVEEELRNQREDMNQRFADVQHAMDRRFEAADKRFDDMHHSFARTQWLIGIGFVMVTAAVTVFGVLG